MKKISIPAAAIIAMLLTFVSVSCDRAPGSYTFLYIHEGDRFEPSFETRRQNTLTEAWFEDDVSTDGFTILDDDIVIRSRGNAVLTLNGPIRVMASNVTFENLNIRLGSDLVESPLIIASEDGTLEDIRFSNVVIETYPGSAYHAMEADDIKGFTLENVKIGETIGAAVYLTATEGISIARLDTGKIAGPVGEITENDAALMLGWEAGKTMKPCSADVLSTAEPIYAEAAIYVDSDGSVYSPPLGSKGQHMMERASTPIPVEAKLSEIRDKLNAYSPKQDVAEDTEADENITIGYWWNIVGSEEETI